MTFSKSLNVFLVQKLLIFNELISAKKLLQRNNKGGSEKNQRWNGTHY